eukprot:c10278_g1_i2.p1 GENE.c10278_g1_i2~~c10278_g1_i2.p1  ORF type:complete len:151 (+),score=41.57 c10278_g1_i2:109-561(+)
MATPSQTVYVNNLNEKIKIADLKRALYSAFSQFGTILDIVAKKRKRAAAEADEEGDVGEPAAKRAKPDEDEAAPHNILFVRGLPETATEKMVSTLFAQYPGFKEASLVPGQPGIAFVEYEAVQQATTALMGLQGLALPPSSKLSIAYAKQ